jgi:hypothetical protein
MHWRWAKLLLTGALDAVWVSDEQVRTMRRPLAQPTQIGPEQRLHEVQADLSAQQSISHVSPALK